jgi:hypothetical protein
MQDSDSLEQKTSKRSANAQILIPKNLFFPVTVFTNQQAT